MVLRTRDRGHRVDLVSAPGQFDTDTVVRVVLDPPGGPALASQPLDLAVLIDANAAGVDGATATLRRIAGIVTALFTAQAQAVWDTPPPMPVQSRDATPVGRAFPQLRLDQRAAPPSTPPPLHGPATNPRDAGGNTDHHGQNR